MSMMTAADAERIRALVISDSEAEAALRGAYHGRHDVVDALWWRAYPATTAPSGHADPAGRRLALRAAAYSRDGSSSPAITVIDKATGDQLSMAASAKPLYDLERQLESDENDLVAAVESARAAIDEAQRRADERAESARAELAGVTDAGDPRAGAATSGPEATWNDRRAAAREGAADTAGAVQHSAAAWRRRSMVWMWTAVACGILLLIGVGVIVMQQLTPGSGLGAMALAGAGESVTPTPSVSGRVTLGLTIFDDPTLAPAIPPANIDPYYQPDSLRLLGVANSDLTVYAVENRLNQPCLLAVYTDGTQSATCVTHTEFMSMGIELRITSLRVTRASEPGAAASDDVVFWNPDGSYGVSSTPAVLPTPAAGG